MPQSFVKSSGAPSKAVAWQHPPVGSPSLHAASVAVAFECRSRPHARSEAGCSPAQHHGGKNIGHHVGCVPNMILSKCSPDWGFSFKETEKKLGKNMKPQYWTSKLSSFLIQSVAAHGKPKTKKYRPSGRMRIRTTVQLWVGLQTETGQMSTQDRLVEMWNTRGWTWEDCEISLGWKMVTGNVTYSYWKNWFVWSRKWVLDIVWVIWSVLNAMWSCGFKKRSFPRWLCRYRRCFRSHAPCSRFSWSAMLWPRTKTDQKGGSQSPNFEPTAKTTSSANHRKSPFRPPGQKAWQTCPRCATATPCLAKPRALGTNAASPEARPDATSALKQGISNRNNRRNIYVNQIGKVLCRRNTTYLLTLFMDLVASLQLLWVILSCVYGTWCSSKTRWWF